MLAPRGVYKKGVRGKVIIHTINLLSQAGDLQIKKFTMSAGGIGSFFLLISKEIRLIIYILSGH